MDVVRKYAQLDKLEIMFNDPGATYKAGENITGALLLELKDKLKIKGIKLLFMGVGRVSWDEKKAYTKGSSSKCSHRNIDSYLDETYMVLGRADTLEPGRYNWPFNIKLPLYLPATYTGQYGRVYYAVRMVIERPLMGDIEYTKSFSVIGVRDLNNDTDARKPIENVVEMSIGPACCKSGPVMGHLALSQSGFAVGQSIKFRARIENGSKKRLNVRLVLSQQTTFRADKQQRKSSTVIKVLTKGEIVAGENVTWEDEMKAIPTVPPTGLGGNCRTIDVKYMLTLVMTPSGIGSNIEVPVEVLIGSIALRSGERRSSSFSGASLPGEQSELEAGQKAAHQLFLQKTSEHK